MASLLFRAARTASAASRAAPSSTGAAAADLAIGSALRGVPSTNRRFSFKFSDGGFPIPVREPFVADEKDLESDEALWAFYERWRKHYNLERDCDEMAYRFDEFKRTVFRVHRVNSSNLPYRSEVNMFADGKLSEIYGFKKPDMIMDEKVENMPESRFPPGRYNP
ncbi:unnamed protein product [Urochloa decumbens]|uniref:Cathepsin propeptide inhibitor domain-containing protein n=1 Tax=Urochloa decumbens TaxID=240449 RepID=A0ABC8Z4N6_9POAL